MPQTLLSSSSIRVLMRDMTPPPPQCRVTEHSPSCVLQSFWPAVIRSSLTPKGIFGLIKSGPVTIRGAVAMFVSSSAIVDSKLFVIYLRVCFFAAVTGTCVWLFVSSVRGIDHCVIFCIFIHFGDVGFLLCLRIFCSLYLLILVNKAVFCQRHRSVRRQQRSWGRLV